MLLADLERAPISFVGDVTILNIGQAHDELAAVLAEDGPVVVDIDGLTEVDLTFVQLIEAARRKAVETGRTFTLRHPAAGAVLEVLQRGGFLGDETSDRDKFWLQGTAQ